MKNRIVAIAMVGIVMLTVGCSSQPITGKVIDKYIEDRTEYTLVVEAENGDIHHFTVDEEQWRIVNEGDQINSDALDQPEN